MARVPLPGTRVLRGYLHGVVAADLRNLVRLAAAGF